MSIPKPIIYVALVLLILAMIPPALIARSRAVPTDRRRLHLVQDMDNQGKFRAQQASTLFNDGRAMRPPVVGAVARGESNDDDHFNRGVVRDASGDVAWAEAFPSQTPVNVAFVKHGQERFNIYCQPCHGASGYGDGIVNKRAMELVETGKNGTTWVQPKNLHEAAIRQQPVGQIFNTITHGIRTMPSHESQIPVADRWAIVAYVKALQRSQHAELSDVPADQRGGLPVIELPKTQESKP